MRKIFLILLFSISFLLKAQIIFEKTYGGTGGEVGSFFEPIADGGFIITGGTNSFGAGWEDVYLIKTDSLGNIVWMKTYGGTGYDYGKCVRQTTDGGFIITGASVNSFNTDTLGDVYLIKTDSLGNSQWSKIIGGIYLDYGSSVIQSTDGGFIIAGRTERIYGDDDVYLIKTDINGDTLWTKTFGGSFNEWANEVIQTTDGGYAITGWTNGPIYLIKTDANGNELWSSTFGGTNGEMGNSISQTVDGGFIITGRTRSFGSNTDRIYLVKTDTIGKLLWSKVYGSVKGFDYVGEYVEQTTDGGYVIVGDRGEAKKSSDIYLIKTDTIGNLQWSKNLCSNPNVGGGKCVREISDGSYIISGGISANNMSDANVYLIKTDSNGNGCEQINVNLTVLTPPTIVAHPIPQIFSNGIISNPNTQINTGGSQNTICFGLMGVIDIIKSNFINIYPNSSPNGIFSIEFSDNKKREITVYNLLGEKIVQMQCREMKTKITLNSGSGIYFISVKDEGGSLLSGKVIIE